jgi:serine-type D-Ala-D-Ala carboxypeptidase/endopeptidase
VSDAPQPAASDSATDAAPPDGAAPDPRFTALDAYLDERLGAGLNGFAMQVYDRDDRLVYQREAGRCATKSMCPDESPAFTVDLQTSIASSTKWVTSTTVLAALEDLVASGRTPSLGAALDTKVVPLITCPERAAGPIVEITMRQLLSFTSGLVPDHACVNQRSSTLTSCACEILRDSATAMVASPDGGTAKANAHPPGTTYKYGAAHLTVAGAALEAVTGKPFDAVFEAKVRSRLGLTMRYTNDSNLAGSIRASVADYAKFVAAVFHDGLGDGAPRLLSKAAVEEQRADQVPASALVRMSPADPFRYGLNTWRFCYPQFSLADVGDEVTTKHDPSCAAVFQSGHGGKGGYTPFLDVGGRYYAVFAMREESEGGGAEYPAAERGLTHRVRLLTHLAMSGP